VGIVSTVREMEKGAMKATSASRLFY
jgi:hypothetical protein